MEKENKGRIEELTDLGKEYVNMKVDEVKLRSVSHLAMLSNKLIVILLAVMVGGVVLQLIGLAISYFIGELLGNIACGFFIMALFFIFVLALLFIFRKRLFLNKLVQLFIGVFFDKENKE